MGIKGRVLLADDDGTFLASTRRILERNGFECQCVEEADAALQALRDGRFDVLVADICMPNNGNLRVVREAASVDPSVPVILVTGYPSMSTAIPSVELSVRAYLTKPLDITDLLMRVRDAIGYSRDRHELYAIQNLLGSCVTDLRGSQAGRSYDGRRPGELVPLSTVRTLASCLSQLLDLAQRSGADWAAKDLCRLLQCPRWPVLRNALTRTVRTLEETRSTFKSKTLASLRQELEQLLDGRDKGA